MDAKGNYVIQPQFKNARAFNKGLTAVHDDKTDLYGFIGTKGKLVIPYKYNYQWFKNGIAKVRTEDSYEIYINGNEIMSGTKGNIEEILI